MSEVSSLPWEESLSKRYEALFRVARAVGAHRDAKELFRVLAGELRGAVDFDFIGLFLYDESTHSFENPILETVHGSGISIPLDFPPEETITWWIYHHQQPVVIPSRDKETRFPRMMELYKQYGVQAACLFPLTTAHRRLDSLGFGVEHPREYTEEEIRYLSLVADQVALAVDNALRQRFWAVGPQAGEILYDGGRRRATMQGALANYDSTAATYRQTTLTAFQEVEDNLAALRILEGESQQQQEAVSAAEESLQLFTNRYKGGVDTYLQVINAQTTALSNERNNVDILRRRMDGSVLLIKALGGGWSVSELPKEASIR